MRVRRARQSTARRKVDGPAYLSIRGGMYVRGQGETKSALVELESIFVLYLISKNKTSRFHHILRFVTHLHVPQIYRLTNLIMITSHTPPSIPLSHPPSPKSTRRKKHPTPQLSFRLQHPNLRPPSLGRHKVSFLQCLYPILAITYM